MPPVFERIGVFDALNSFPGNLRQAAVPDHMVDVFQTGKTLADLGERKIRAEKFRLICPDSAFKFWRNAEIYAENIDYLKNKEIIFKIIIISYIYDKY